VEGRKLRLFGESTASTGYTTSGEKFLADGRFLDSSSTNRGERFTGIFGNNKLVSPRTRQVVGGLEKKKVRGALK